MGSTVAAIAGLAAAGLSSVGSLAQGRSAQKQANFQAAVQNQQARLQRQQAERQRKLAEIENVQLRRKQSRDLAAARVRLAAGGRETSSGSALLLQEDAAATNEFNALLSKSIGLERAHALENQANLSNFDARLQQMRGSSARQAGLFGAGTSLLRGVSSFASDLDQINRRKNKSVN